MFLLAIVLIVLNSYTFMLLSKDQITGKVGAEGTTKICIGMPTSITNPTPGNNAVLNGTFNSTLSGTDTTLVKFYWYYSGSPETEFGTDNDADSDYTFNSTLNTTAIPDGNCNYRIIARSEGLCGTRDVKGSGIFSVNNIDVPPTWTEFNNSLSTNFSNYTSWANIPSAKIGIWPYGTIEFTTTNLDSADLDYMFNITYNFITMNVSWDIASCFSDVQYKMTFFNVTNFAEPVVLKNGQRCGTYCGNLLYEDGNYSFTTRVSNEFANFSIGEGGNLTINFTFPNKTFDNSPTINISTYMHGSLQDVPKAAICYYKTDYNPADYTIMDITGQINQSSQLPEQNWSYLPTNMGHYEYIQHYNYYTGLHTLWVNCTVGYQDREQNTTFRIVHTDRDRVYYSDGNTMNLYLRLEEEGLNISVDLSQIDSNFNPANVTVINTGLDYNISYNISATNTRPDGQYNATIEAFNSTGGETMNGSIFIHLHNTWTTANIDDAFDCWNFKQGYHFDEVACDWESDLNQVADLVDVFTIEVSCFDSIDNDFDTKTDYNDTDCAGIYYAVRRFEGIDSAFLGDPCFNNVCRVCVGASDSNDDGICDTSEGVNVRYLNKVRPGAPFKAKFLKSSINNLSVRVSINFLETGFNITNSTSYIEQLPRKELGGCTNGEACRSVTGTTFGPGLPDRFTGALNEKLTMILSNSSIDGTYAGLAAGKSIGGSSAFQNLVYFEVRNNAIINESDNATYCFDNEDNDLNEILDCFDPSCNLTYNPQNLSQRCEYPNEITCDDGYDNDRDGYADCNDNDCYKKNGTNGPCYAVENYSASSCADRANNDFDWGYRCDASTSESYQTRQTLGHSGTIRLTDCLDIDCDGMTGNVTLNASCEYCNERTCNDKFDNDVDAYYDCTGNAYHSSYERDCDRWHDIILTCPTNETNCTDNYDNDLDSDSTNGEYSWLGIPVFGGWNCLDLDCNGKAGNPDGKTCQWRNETICDDSFDNDADGLTDCYDPVSCKGLSGGDIGYPGICRPCAEVENISIDSCRDTDDNDFDGQTDCLDANCTGLPGPGTAICGSTESNCTDGIDNDNDWRTDYNDTDCTTTTSYANELGPGQCSDSIDNDLDNSTDCSDAECANTLRCRTGSYNNPCVSIGYVGAIEVGRTRFVRAGTNLSACYSRPSLSAASVVLKLGNIDNNLRNMSPTIDDNTSFMTGTTANFAKVNDTYGLKAQNTDGFSGALSLNLTSTTGNSTLPGDYTIFVSTSIPGIYGTRTTTTYIAENEPPTINSISVTTGNRLVSPGRVNVSFNADVTDNATYNSGIAFCTINLSGVFYGNRSSCSYTTDLPSGDYNISFVSYDGALNPSNATWKKFTVNISTVPVQKGAFYNPYPAENYPDRKFFNQTELLNIGVNFEGGTGFTSNTTGCTVEILNSTHNVSTQYISLTETSGEAHCNGQVNLSVLFNRSAESYPSKVYYFRVYVNDNSSNTGTSEIQDINFCYYYYDNSSSKYRCMDICALKDVLNKPPVLIAQIPNLTWPRGTKLSIIDLDDYFSDPDNDPLNYTWTIDTTRINVSIDPSNIVTFDPAYSFSGVAHITFYANDPFSSTPSNLVELEVTFTPFETPTIPPSGGGGGGGGGGAAGKVNLTQIPTCEEDWTCSDWGPCLPSGYQTRTCRDRNECGSANKMPPTTQECTYIPTCRDRIRNQGEEGVDCGGPCPPCPGCRDSILNQQEEKTGQIMSADEKDRSDCGGPFCPVCPTCQDNKRNQGEEGIDCGGPCKSCATCNDGIRNQGEQNIDCGGPCPQCRIRLQEVAFNWNLLILASSALFLLAMMLTALIIIVFKKKFIRLKAKLLNYYMRSIRMFESKKAVEKEMPILQWANAHLDAIEAGISSKGTEQLISETDRLARIFFKRVFLIRYAFTTDELVKELDKQHMSPVLKKASELLFEELGQVKYGGEAIKKDEVKTIIDQMKVIADRIVSEVETKKKTKISISERDIDKISETLQGAHTLGVNEAFKKIKK